MSPQLYQYWTLYRYQMIGGRGRYINRFKRNYIVDTLVERLESPRCRAGYDNGWQTGRQSREMKETSYWGFVAFVLSEKKQDWFYPFSAFKQKVFTNANLETSYCFASFISPSLCTTASSLFDPKLVLLLSCHLLNHVLT